MRGIIRFDCLHVPCATIILLRVRRVNRLTRRPSDSLPPISKVIKKSRAADERYFWEQGGVS